jgi:hypothetical protein
MAGVTHDAGALIAAERNDRAMWALHAGFFAEEVLQVVPVPALAQAWRGGSRQASLVRPLAGCQVDELDYERASAVGRLVERSGIDDVVDASVVEAAPRRGGDVVMSSDPADLQQIARSAGQRLRIEVV